jgi:serine/arginine repetitive matrix protein 2
MFNNATDLGPLTSISASPPESATRHHVGSRSSFDSIIDDEHRSSQEDSLFEKTHYRSSMSSDSVFGDEFHF